MKQSSIEWLKEHLTVSFNDDIILLLHFFEQAKAMHKKEIENAYISNSMIRTRSKAEEYYNETFNRKEK